MSIPCSCKASKSEQYREDVLRLTKKFAEQGIISTPGKVAAEIQRDWIEGVRDIRGDRGWNPCGGCKSGRLLMVASIMKDLGLVPEKSVRKMSVREASQVLADQLLKVNTALEGTNSIDPVSPGADIPDLLSAPVGGYDCPASQR